MSAVTNSTSNPNSSATIESVSASRRWFMVTIMPKDIHAEIIWVTWIFIMVANSLTVTNSVTLSNLLSASACAISSSDFWRWLSLFSRRYFAPFPFEDLPWSFSSVSRTCRCTSSSLGSSFVICERPLAPFWFLLTPVVSLLIRRRLPRFSRGSFDLSSLLRSGFLNWDKSMVLPVKLGPSSFLYWVLTEPSSATSLGCSVGSFCSAGSSVATSSCFCSTSFSSATALTSSFSTAAGSSFFFGSRSILPSILGPESLASAFTTSCTGSGFTSGSFSNSWRNSSFSLRFSSPTSLASTFLDLSVWNSVNNTWYSSSEILVVGRASTTYPLDPKNSTARSNEILNSLKTLFIRIVLPSAINAFPVNFSRILL